MGQFPCQRPVVQSDLWLRVKVTIFPWKCDEEAVKLSPLGSGGRGVAQVSVAWLWLVVTLRDVAFMGGAFFS